MASFSPSFTASSQAFCIASQSKPLCSKNLVSSPAKTARCRFGDIYSIGVQIMNFLGSRPSFLASEILYSINDVVVGFSVRRFQTCRNVAISYISQIAIAPRKIKNKILVQYHI